MERRQFNLRDLFRCVTFICIGLGFLIAAIERFAEITGVEPGDSQVFIATCLFLVGLVLTINGATGGRMRLR